MQKKPMSDDLKYPDPEAAHSVLTKLGVDPGSRFGPDDQDFQYTACRVEEFDSYVGLYSSDGLSDREKRILGCFMLEGLNEHLQTTGAAHPRQGEAFELLHADRYIHESELEYWSDGTDPNPDNWWPIAEYLQAWKRN